MEIILFGATGFVGTAIETELVERGHRVIAIARSLEGKSVPDGVIAKTGSLFDYNLVTSAADAIVVAVPFREIDGRKLIEAVPALLEPGIRVGIVGGAGSLLAEDGRRLVDHPGFPDEYKPESLAAADVLEMLKASDTPTDWFFVSPAEEFGGYNPGERTGTYRLGTDTVVRDADGHSYISGADFAIAFVDELEHPAHHRERFTVAY
jgi:uncharacterized protein